MKLDEKVKASMVVVDCGRDLYHLECARREFGDDKVLDCLRGFYRREEGLSAADASIRAGYFFKDIDRLKVRGFGFKEIRLKLEQEKRAEQVERGPDPAFLPA